MCGAGKAANKGISRAAASQRVEARFAQAPPLGGGGGGGEVDVTAGSSRISGAEGLTDYFRMSPCVTTAR